MPVTKPLPILSLSSANTTVVNHRRRVMSRQLFGTTREVVIEHNGQEYLLRQTRHGKLILNK